MSVCRVRIASSRHAAIGVLLQPRLPLDDDQRADSLPRELHDGTADLINRLLDVLLGVREGEIEPGARLAELFECAPQFRLEDDRHGDHEGGEGDFQQPSERGEIERRGENGDHAEQNGDATQERHRPRPARHREQPEENNRHDENIEQRERRQAREYPRQFEGNQQRCHLGAFRSFATLGCGVWAARSRPQGRTADCACVSRHCSTRFHAVTILDQTSVVAGREPASPIRRQALCLLPPGKFAHIVRAPRMRSIRASASSGGASPRQATC